MRIFKVLYFITAVIVGICCFFALFYVIFSIDNTVFLGEENNPMGILVAILTPA